MCFDDYIPFAKNIKNKCELIHVVNWFNLFVNYYYNEEVSLLS